MWLLRGVYHTGPVGRKPRCRGLIQCQAGGCCQRSGARAGGESGLVCLQRWNQSIAGYLGLGSAVEGLGQGSGGGLRWLGRLELADGLVGVRRGLFLVTCAMIGV